MRLSTFDPTNTNKYFKFVIHCTVKILYSLVSTTYITSQHTKIGCQDKTHTFWFCKVQYEYTGYNRTNFQE